jgi:hypothetical protein
MEQDHVAGPGRPKEPGTWGTHDSPHGRDPLAIKDLGKTFSLDKSPLQQNYRGGSPLSTENIDTKALIKTMASKIKTKQVLKESLNTEKKDQDSGTLLDESNLLDINLT